jgi:hypothetical protein
MNHSSVVSAWSLNPDLLKQYGAYEAEIWCKGYEHNRPALIVPTGAETRARAMFLDDKLPKYNWLPGDQRPRPTLFDPAGILATKPSRVILSNGDKTTLLFAQLGIPAVSTFGEGNKVTDAAAMLAAAGVKTLVNYPDSDLNGKGIKAAYKWLKVGFEAGIEVITLDYGQWLLNQFGDDPAAYDGWDLRDLYLKDRDGFLPALESMKPIQWERYSDLLPKEKSQRDYTAEGTDELPAQFLIDVKKALGITEEYNSDGFTRKPVKCPLKAHKHDDVAPAAYWHEDNFLKCHKCHSEGETANAKAVGAALHLHLRDYFDHVPASHNPKLSESLPAGDIELYHFPKFPDALRRLFMGLSEQFPQYADQTPGLICLEAIHEMIRAGSMDPTTDVITRRQMAAIRGIKEATTARTGLDQLTALGWLSKLETSGAAQYTVLPIAQALETMRGLMASQHRQNCYPAEVANTDDGPILPIPADITPGMIAAEYPDLSQQQLEQAVKVLNDDRALMYQDFAQERAEADHQLQIEVKRLGNVLTLEWLLTAPSTHLATDDTWGNGSDYRASFYRARVQWRHNQKKTITQAQAAAELGISPKALYNLRQKHGIALDEQFEEIRVDAPAAVFEVMPRWAARRQWGNEVVSSSGKKLKDLSDRQEVTKWVAAEIRGGNHVTLRVQTGSLERFAGEEERAAMETRLEAQKARARARRNDYEDQRRDKEARLQLEQVEKSLQETITEFNREWVKQQLDLKPGWEFLLDAIQLGAVIEPAKITDIRTQPVSSIGKICRLPDRAVEPLPTVTPFERRPAPAQAQRTEANIMYNFPFFEAAMGGRL